MTNAYGQAFRNNQAVVVGAGRSGMAAVRLLIHLGARVRLLEKNCEKMPDSFKLFMQENAVECICGEHTAEHFADAAYIIPSPGIPITELEPLFDKAISQEVLGEVELAWRCLEDEKILAITGTSGKTTTVSLAAAMLKEQGFEVFLGGNIGTPLSEYVLQVAEGGKKADVLVLEMSSFQLQTCKHFHAHVAVLLNITENHLDYHKDMKEYLDAKMQIFANQTENDFAIAPRAVQYFMLDYLPKARVFILDDPGTEKGDFSIKQLFGEHNEQNIQAAWLACKKIGVKMENAQKAVAKFEPLAHRLEKVREHKGVLYVNDSKCTTVDAMRVALQSFGTRPVILLCGGKFKGGELKTLRTLVMKNVKYVQLMGDSREYFVEAWQDIVPMQWAPNMDEALVLIKEMVEEGDVVLLSPGTSSYDLYANYIERGKHFKSLVEAL